MIEAPISLKENPQSHVLSDNHPFREKIGSLAKKSSKLASETLLRGVLWGGGTWFVTSALTDLLPLSLPNAIEEITSHQMLGSLSITMGVIGGVLYLSGKIGDWWYGSDKKS